MNLPAIREELKTKMALFRRWQRRPHQVAPLSDTEHCCATCGTTFRGNYCPRCGQSAKVGRYSLKSALLLFLDVWGLGNRGMFRSIRDLLLRPGYMIRDYLSGMQMAYFPPFKMFFLFIAFSVIVDSGLNILGEDRLGYGPKSVLRGMKEGLSDDAATDKATEKINKAAAKIGAGVAKIKGTVDSAAVANTADSVLAGAVKDIVDSTVVAVSEGKELTPEEKKMNEKAMRMAEGYRQHLRVAVTFLTDWLDEHPNMVRFLWLIVLSGPLFLFFRRCPAMPDIRYSEFFVAIVYTTNMMTLITTIGGFLCLSQNLVKLCAYLLSVVPLKQLTGYRYRQTLWRIVGAFVLLGTVAVVLVAIVVGAIFIWFVN